MARPDSLQQLAQRALCDLRAVTTATVAHVATHSFNSVFRITTADGLSALRVGAADRIHPRGVEDVEAAWLDALAEQGITSLRNIALPDSTRWATASHPEVPGDRIVTRFRWVDGVELRTCFDDVHAVRAGRLLARLHEHAATTPHDVIPASLHARSAVYLGDRNLIADHQSPHGAALRDAMHAVQDYLDALWASDADPHLLHGDFGPHNILIDGEQLQPIDFQDLRYGFAIQDLGVTLADLSRKSPELIPPLLRGYASTRELPDLSPANIATMAAARSLNIVNLALQSPDSGIGALFDSHAAHVVDWIRHHA